MLEIKDLENKIFNADCLQLMKQIPDKSIDLVLTGHQHHPWASEYSSGIFNDHYTTILTCGSPTIENPRGFRFNSYNRAISQAGLYV